jgi:hypothetical protein
MRNLAPAVCLILATSAAAYLPFHPPQQPFKVQPSSDQASYDGHQVWRLDWESMDVGSKLDFREAISVRSLH